MDTIRIGLIGSGGMAARNAQTFSQHPNFTLSAIAARNPKTGSELAAKHNVPCVSTWQALCDNHDIDALVISSNNESHGPIVLAGLETNKHIFCEYPIARQIDALDQIQNRLSNSKTVLRVSHNEPISATHQALKKQTSKMGDLMTALFTRLTPGRGARPEALFNLPLTGPPSLFFVYHVYPLVDIFGPVAWVKAGAHYEGLKDNGQYHRFVNTVTAQFQNGGLAQWNWAGGIEVESAEEYRRIILSNGTLIHEADQWHISKPSGTKPMPCIEEKKKSLIQQFLDDIQTASTWQHDTQVAIDAARVGLAAEQSANENSVVTLT